MKANVLKATDLMVGDLVLHDGKVIRVDAVHIRKIGYHKTKEKLTWLFSGQFEPILLTPEILEKNGFERDKNISLYNAYTGINSRVTLHDDFMLMNSRNMWDVHIDSEDYCTIANCELTYVHELQHLLRICKIDFEFSV
jgi:hypothetical protein